MPSDLAPIPPLGEPPDVPDLEDLDRVLEYREETPEIADAHPMARWSITNDGAAEWAMRHLAQVDRDLRSVQDQYQEWVRQLDEWMVGRVTRLGRRAKFFKDHLDTYGLARRELTGQATLDLPSGKVATRAGNPRLAVSDSELLVLALERLGRADLVRVRKDVPVSQLSSDPELAVRFNEVKAIWKVGLDCGCVVLATDPDTFPACPECGTVSPLPVDVEVEVDGYWEVWVSIDGKQVQLPGLVAVPPVTTATVTVR